MDNKSEIDKRVAQELKNNTDFIYQTNQALQNLRFDFSALETELHQQLAIYDSHLRMLSRKCEGTDAMCEVKMHKCYETLEEYRTQGKDTLTKVEKFIADAKMEFAKRSVRDQDMALIVSEHQAINNRCDRISASVASESNHVFSKLRSELAQLRQTIEDRPSEIPALRKEFVDKSEVFNKNYDGMKDEVASLKYSVFLMQKHIEDLYSIIEKLKAGK
jgi:ribosomal protein S21